MSRNIIACQPQDSLEDAVRKMWECDVGCLPVIEEDRVVGVITDRDACMAAYTQGRLLGDIAVSSAMARDVCACSPTDRIENVEEMMARHQIRRIPVIDDGGQLVGLVSMNDITRHSARSLRKRAPDIAPERLISTLAAICEPRQSAAAAQ
jgi:CBS domain-containing protein